MSMLNWKEYRQGVKTTVSQMAKYAPEAVKGYVALSTSGGKAKHIDGKTRELISLAVAVTTKCDGCIASHVEAAISHGVSREELSEALGIAIAMNAGGALVYSTRAIDCYESMAADG